MKIYSLKKRLLISIGFPTVVAGLLVALLAFTFSWKEVDEVYDAQMAHMARVLVDLSKKQVETGTYNKIQMESEVTRIQHSYERKTGYRLWYKNDLMIESFKAHDFGDLRPDDGFSNLRIKNKPWRFFVYEDNDFRVEISERYAIRYELIGQLVISLVLPALLFLPVLMFLVWVGTEKSLKPLVRLSGDVDVRKMDDLNPIPAENIPLEVTPLVQAMNRLFLRIGESFRREREFTDHAAHELRTPLAAMKTQTQVLMKKAALIPEYQDGLENLHATIDRTSHMLEQLLSLARLQNEKFPLHKIDLSELVHDVLDDVASHIRAKNQILETHIGESIMINGHEYSLSIMLRNLIDNAIKYTPQNGRIVVTLDKSRHLMIADSGPGISNENKKKAFQRFSRFDKTGQSGTGLGLSIVQWIVDAHQARVRLEDNKGSGLVVRIEWDAPV